MEGPTNKFTPIKIDETHEDARTKLLKESEASKKEDAVIEQELRAAVNSFTKKTATQVYHTPTAAHRNRGSNLGFRAKSQFSHAKDVTILDTEVESSKPGVDLGGSRMPPLADGFQMLPETRVVTLVSPLLSPIMSSKLQSSLLDPSAARLQSEAQPKEERGASAHPDVKNGLSKRFLANGLNQDLTRLVSPLGTASPTPQLEARGESKLKTRRHTTIAAALIAKRHLNQLQSKKQTLQRKPVLLEQSSALNIREDASGCRQSPNDSRAAPTAPFVGSSILANTPFSPNRSQDSGLLKIHKPTLVLNKKAKLSPTQKAAEEQLAIRAHQIVRQEQARQALYSPDGHAKPNVFSEFKKNLSPASNDLRSKILSILKNKEESLLSSSIESLGRKYSKDDTKRRIQTLQRRHKITVSNIPGQSEASSPVNQINSEAMVLPMPESPSKDPSTVAGSHLRIEDHSINQSRPLSKQNANNTDLASHYNASPAPFIKDQQMSINLKKIDFDNLAQPPHQMQALYSSVPTQESSKPAYYRKPNMSPKNKLGSGKRSLQPTTAMKTKFVVDHLDQRKVLKFINKQVKIDTTKPFRHNSTIDQSRQISQDPQFQRFLSPLSGKGQPFDKRRYKGGNTSASRSHIDDSFELGDNFMRFLGSSGRSLDQRSGSGERKLQKMIQNLYPGFAYTPKNAKKFQANKLDNIKFWDPEAISKANQAFKKEQSDISNAIVMKHLDLKGANLFEHKYKQVNKQQGTTPMIPIDHFFMQPVDSSNIIEYQHQYSNEYDMPLEQVSNRLEDLRSPVSHITLEPTMMKDFEGLGQHMVGPANQFQSRNDNGTLLKNESSSNAQQPSFRNQGGNMVNVDSINSSAIHQEFDSAQNPSRLQVEHKMSMFDQINTSFASPSNSISLSKNRSHKATKLEVVINSGNHSISKVSNRMAADSSTVSKVIKLRKSDNDVTSGDQLNYQGSFDNSGQLDQGVQTAHGSEDMHSSRAEGRKKEPKQRQQWANHKDPDMYESELNLSDSDLGSNRETFSRKVKKRPEGMEQNSAVKQERDILQGIIIADRIDHEQKPALDETVLEYSPSLENRIRQVQMNIHSGEGAQYSGNRPAANYQGSRLMKIPNYSNLRPGVPLISNKIVRVENTLVGMDRQKLFQAIKKNSPYARKLQAKFGSGLKKRIPIAHARRSPPESNDSSSNPVSILLAHHQPRFPADLSLLNIGEEPVAEGIEHMPHGGDIASGQSNFVNVVNSTEFSYESPILEQTEPGQEMKIVASNVKVPAPLIEMRTDDRGRRILSIQERPSEPKPKPQALTPHNGLYKAPGSSNILPLMPGHPQSPFQMTPMNSPPQIGSSPDASMSQQSHSRQYYLQHAHHQQQAQAQALLLQQPSSSPPSNNLQIPQSQSFSREHHTYDFVTHGDTPEKKERALLQLPSSSHIHQPSSDTLSPPAIPGGIHYIKHPAPSTSVEPGSSSTESKKFKKFSLMAGNHSVKNDQRQAGNRILVKKRLSKNLNQNHNTSNHAVAGGVPSQTTNIVPIGRGGRELKPNLRIEGQNANNYPPSSNFLGIDNSNRQESQMSKLTSERAHRQVAASGEYIDYLQQNRKERRQKQKHRDHSNIRFQQEISPFEIVEDNLEINTVNQFQNYNLRQMEEEASPFFDKAKKEVEKSREDQYLKMSNKKSGKNSGRHSEMNQNSRRNSPSSNRGSSRRSEGIRGSPKNDLSPGRKKKKMIIQVDKTAVNHSSMYDSPALSSPLIIPPRPVNEP